MAHRVKSRQPSASENGSAAKKLKSILGKTKFVLNQCYPGWGKGCISHPPICVPVCFDILKSYVASKDIKAAGYKRNTLRRHNSLIIGDDAELIFYNRIKAANIGGIVIAKFQWQSFRKALQLEELDIDSSALLKRPRQQLQEIKNGDFETDFIILHPQIGIFAVEVKASPNITSSKQSKYKEAARQLHTFSEKIFDVYRKVTTKELCSEDYCGAAIFAPNSNLDFPSSHPFEHICPCYDSTNDEFIDFWNRKIEMSILKYGQRNLFEKHDFRLFLLSLIGYRTDSFISGPKFSLSLAIPLQTQKYTPLLQKGNVKQAQKNPLLRRIKWNGVNEMDIFLTAEQNFVLQGSEPLQLICGAPGTGKTIILLLKALEAAKKKRKGRVMIQTWTEFQPKLENIVKFYKKEFKREVVFSNVYDMPNDDDDVFRDEMGLNALPFLVLRAREHVTGRTLAVFTGNVTSGDFRQEFDLACKLLHNTAERKYAVYDLNTQMRSTKNIVSFWTIQHGIGNMPPMGHDFEGESVVHKSFLLVTQVLKEVSDTLRKLLTHSVSPSSIAIIGLGPIIGPRHTEVDEMLSYLKPLFENSGISFGSAKDSAEAKDDNMVTVDKHAATLSNEWIFVIAFSLRCTDFHENFYLTASSRAICSLFVYERDYGAIQDNIEAYFDHNKPHMFKNEAVKQLAQDAILRLTNNTAKESYSEAIIWHQHLTVLRKDYVAGKGVVIQPFYHCDSFSKCLKFVLNDEHQLRCFVYAMSETGRKLKHIKDRMEGVKHQTPEMILLPPTKFFKRLLKMKDDGELGKVYVEFCTRWCEIVIEFYHEIDDLTKYQSLSICLPNNYECKMVICAANKLVQNRCGIRFLPIKQEI